MLLNIPLLADLQLIRDNRQLLIDENLRQQNLKRRFFDYQVGQLILILNSKLHPDKFKPRAPEGPFPLIQIHVNGTVTIRRDEYITERIVISDRTVSHIEVLCHFWLSSIFFLPRCFT